MVKHFSLKFNVTTTPENRRDASPHSGSWSEGYWAPDEYATDGSVVNDIANRRAGFLPAQASVIGWRVQQYTISQNKLLPGGSQTFKKRFPGIANFSLDAPQVSLQYSASVVARSNTIRFTTRCIPDDNVVGGELSAGTLLFARLNAYRLALVTGAVGGIVRDLSQPSVRVLRIQAGGLVILAAGSGLVADDYMRLNRVRDAQGNPVSGAFRVSSINFPVYTVLGLDPTLTAGEGGTARKDLVVFAAFSSINNDRVVVRKIGAPFERYRGRRSRRRA